MKSPLRSTAPVLGALAAFCLAVPAANAARPVDAPEHPAHPAHPDHPAQANEHSVDAGHAQEVVTAIGDDSAPTGDHSAPAGDHSAPAGDHSAPAGDHSAPAGDDSTPTETSTGAPAAPANPCNQPAGRRVFSPWHDRKAYVLTANGGLEQGDAGWTLADGAAVTEGNDPFFLNDAADHRSLSLPAGSSATSPATCFSAGSPTFRFVARTSGDRQARLRVEVLYTSQNGRKVSRTAGKLRGGDAWRPSKILALAIGRGKGRGRLVSGTVAFRFTPVGAGDWQVDDLFLDPRARH